MPQEPSPSPAGSVPANTPRIGFRATALQFQWAAVPGAKEYNIYRESAGYFGFLGISTGTSFVDNNYEAKTDGTLRLGSVRQRQQPRRSGLSPTTWC